MFILLTNAVQEYSGDKVAINTDYIISVREATVKREDGTQDQVTVIFTEHGTWEVQEPLKTVLKLCTPGIISKLS